MKDIYFQRFKDFNQEQWDTVIKVARITNTVKDLLIDKIEVLYEAEQNVVIEYEGDTVNIYGDNDYDKRRTSSVKLSKTIIRDDCFDDEGNIAFKVRGRAFGHVGNLILHIVARLYPDVIELEEAYEELTFDELIYAETVLLCVKEQTLTGLVFRYPITGHPGNELKATRDGEERVEFKTVYDAMDAVNESLEGLALDATGDTLSVHLIKSGEENSSITVNYATDNGKVKNISKIKFQ